MKCLNIEKERNINSLGHPSLILPSRANVAPRYRERQWDELCLALIFTWLDKMHL